MKFIVISAALARKYGVEVGDKIELDPKNEADKVEGRMRAGLIMPARKTRKRTTEKKAPVDVETAAE